MFCVWQSRCRCTKARTVKCIERDRVSRSRQVPVKCGLGGIEDAGQLIAVVRAGDPRRTVKLNCIKRLTSSPPYLVSFISPRFSCFVLQVKKEEKKGLSDLAGFFEMGNSTGVQSPKSPPVSKWGWLPWGDKLATEDWSS